MTTDRAEPIAVVGMACRFPGAESVEAYWELLRDGVDAISEVPSERWNADRFLHSDPDAPGMMVSRWGGFLRDAAGFDAAFFGIAPREAVRIDPQHRWLAELAFEAIEDAGLPAERLAGTDTGVFIGISQADYPQLLRTEIESLDAYSNIGGALSLAANRLSYLFDLHGPSLAVDTACSSALTGLHFAVRSLRSGESKQALVGAANALFSPGPSIGFSQAHMLSPRGRCRTFDAGADGYVRSEGAAALLLLPASRAEELNLRPRALILATAANQDGRSSGLTVPNRHAQERMIRAALAEAQADARDVVYAEAHGTGTPVGDPIEVDALVKALGGGRSPDDRLRIGSVKTNIGHLEPAAGLAGLIKAILLLERKAIPASLHLVTPNPRLPIDRIHIPTELEPLPEPAKARPLAAVNAFGFGGANAHVLVAPAPEGEEQDETGVEAGRPLLLPLSARSPAALEAYAAAYADLLIKRPELDLEDLCAAAALRKSQLPCRDAILFSDRDDLASRLRADRERPKISDAPRIAFLFCGQGPQHWAMGQQLYRTEPVVRAMWEACHEACRAQGGPDLLSILLADEAHSLFAHTDLAQPALFALQAGLVELWKSWGIEPAAVAGHSVGEAAAAWSAGIYDLDTVFRVIVGRSRAQHRAHGRGRMLAAALTEDEGRKWERDTGGRVSLAAVNAPRQITLAGEAEAVSAVAEALDRARIFNRLLPTEYAFHSSQMDPVRDELGASLAGLSGRDGRLLMVSSVTGERLRGADANAEYWWRNVRQPVLFSKAIEALIVEGCNLYVEIGPHPVLAGALRETAAAARSDALSVASLRRAEDERQTMLKGLATLYRNGAAVRWASLYSPPAKRVPLPAYPWQRQNFWSEAEDAEQALRSPPPHPLLGDREDGPEPIWSNWLDLRRLPWLADHKVLGAVVLPATAYVEMAAAAALELGGEGTVTLEDIRLHRLLFFGERAKVQTRVRLDPKTGTFRVYAATPEWELKAEGRFRIERLRKPPREDVAAMTAAISEPREPQELYHYLDAIGQRYGPSFTAISSLAVRNDEDVLSRIALQGGRGSGRYLLFPPMLDACFHSSVAVKGGRDRRAFVVTEIHRVRMFEPLPDSFWNRLKVVEHGGTSYLGDLRLYDEDGEVLCEVAGLRLRTLDGASADRQALQHVDHLEWIAAAPPAERHSEGTVLIFADEGGLGDAAAAALATRGIPFQLVRREEVDTGSADWAADFWGRFAADPHPDRMLYCWGSARDAGDNCATLLALVQAQPAMTARWVVVTCGGQAVGSEPCDPEQAALWGFVRVVQTEQPNWAMTLTDVDFGSNEACIVELLAREVEPETAWRNGRRLVRRLIRGEVLPGTGAPPPPAWAVTFGQTGRVDTLRLEGRPRPAPGPGELEVELAAAGINFRDLMKVLGIYPAEDEEAIALGDEFAGRVTRVGKGVRNFRPGDRVAGIFAGAFRSHLVVPERVLWPTPAHFSEIEAATSPIIFGTAFHALCRLARLRKDETVLIHAGAGGVGLAAIHIAKAIGARVLATAGSEAKRARLEALGVEHVMDSRSLDFAEETMRYTGRRGVDVVLNSLAGPFQRASLSICAAGGRFVEIGKRDLHANEVLPLDAFRRSLSFFAFDLAAVLRDGGPDARAILRYLKRGDHVALPCRVFPASEVAAAFRSMQAAEHFGKLALRFDADSAGEIPAEFWPRPDGAYLVTGGTRGFGLEVAHWLVARGARHLILLSRSGAIDRVALDRLQASGAAISVVAADIASPEIVSFLKTLAPQLRGVFHCAMVLADASVAQMRPADLATALGPKAAGARHLDQATRAMDLDCFVLFSSISAIIGAPGQANYAAANAYLDALAAERRSQGLPALSIAWGRIGEVGAAAQRPDLGRYLDSIGLRAIRPERALASLGRLMASGETHCLAADVDWRRLTRVSAKFATSPLFASVASEGEEEAGEDSAEGWREHLRSLDAAEQTKAVADMLTRQICATLEVAPVDLSAAAPLAGLDSLMAVELKVRIEEQAGCELPISELNADISLARLAARVLAAMRNGVTPADEVPQVIASPAAIVAPLLTRETRSLSGLIAEGARQPLAAAALMPWPAAWFDRIHWSADAFFRKVNADRVSLDLIIDTPLGSIGLFMLPMTTAQVTPREPSLLPYLVEGVRAAAECGASCVALTGLIPSATGYGVDLVAACAGEGPRITTGHATTVAAVILNLGRLLDAAERSLSSETVMAYGIGSIGLGTLRLMLESFPHPQALHLCDPFRDDAFFAHLENVLRGEHGFGGEVRVVRSGDPIRASVILGATNVGDVLDVSALPPGTLLIDDSAPHCLNAQAAFERFKTSNDILFTEGGFVRAPFPMPRCAFVPDLLAASLPEAVPPVLFSMLAPDEITACILSALLSAREPDLSPTVGLADLHEARKHLEALHKWGFTAALPSFEGIALPAAGLAAFRDREARLKLAS